jgi:hypothetical protein
MRPFRLARIAAEAEGVRLRGMAARIATRAAFAIVALVFLAGALVFLHLAAWYELRTAMDLSYLASAASLGGADLLLAIVLLALASRSAPSRVEIEALEVRRKAVEGIGSALSITALLLPLLRIASSFWRRRRE